MSDEYYKKIQRLMTEVHKLVPTMKYGTVLQTALDTYKIKRNHDLSQVSSKELYSALINFKKKITEGL